MFCLFVLPLLNLWPQDLFLPESKHGYGIRMRGILKFVKIAVHSDVLIVTIECKLRTATQQNNSYDRVCPWGTCKSQPKYQNFTLFHFARYSFRFWRQWSEQSFRLIRNWRNTHRDAKLFILRPTERKILWASKGRCGGIRQNRLNMICYFSVVTVGRGSWESLMRAFECSKIIWCVFYHRGQCLALPEIPLKIGMWLLRFH